MPPVTPRRQQGVIILTFLLLALSVSSYVLLQALNAGAARTSAQTHATQQALTEAKRAVLGYAMSYADGSHAMDKGPGHLPCPDRSGGLEPGIAEGECRQTSNAETGLLPFRTLGLAALADGSGAPLWYAVSENHRSAADPPLNSDTTGTLTVDGAADVVAVIIAPGAPLPGQARGAGTSYNAAAYLEGDNASAGDGIFRSHPAGDFNDRIVTISRAELAAAMEKTVLGEVAQALNDYFHDPDADDDATGNDADYLEGDPSCTVPDCDDGYPWLADFNNPATSTYTGKVDNFAAGEVSFGHLPLARAGVAFDAGFVASWNLDGIAAVYGASGGQPPSEACLRHSDCYQTFSVGAGSASPQLAPAGIRGVSGAGWLQGRCTLDGPTTVSCTATRDFTLSYFSPPVSYSRQLRRVYRLDFSSNTFMRAPTAIARRTVAVQRAGSWTGAPATLTVSDYDMPAQTLIGSATLTVNGMSTGDSIALSDVPFDLEVSDDDTVDHTLSPGELPNWFYANNWQQLVLVHYARAESPGNASPDCGDDGSCLTLNVRRPGAATANAIANVRGLVLAAGARLTAQARPSAARTDYLEGANAVTATSSFDEREVTNTFNDEVVVLAP